MFWMNLQLVYIHGITRVCWIRLKHLRDLGNSVLVVEHDEETIRSADWILDLGPGAGVHGGEIVAEGTIETILAHPKSLTGAYMSGRKKVPMPKKLHPRNGKMLKIIGAGQII